MTMAAPGPGVPSPDGAVIGGGGGRSGHRPDGRRRPGRAGRVGPVALRRSRWRPSLHQALVVASGLLGVGGALGLATTSPTTARLGLGLVVVAVAGAGATVAVDATALRAGRRTPEPPLPGIAPMLRPGPQARAVDLGTAAEHLRRGAAAFDAGRADAASAELGLALETDPRNPAGHALLGQALVADGRPDVAVGAFREALRQEPALVAARVGLGGALLLLGQAQQAYEVTAAARCPALAPMQARALRALHRPAEAGAAVAGVVGGPAALERAWQHLAAGRTAPARAELLSAHGHQPDDLEVLVLLGAVHRAEGRTQEAGSCFAAALGARPAGHTPRRQAELRAAALFGLGRTEEACARLAAALRRRGPGEQPDRVLLDLLALPPTPGFARLAASWQPT